MITREELIDKASFMFAENHIRHYALVGGAEQIDGLAKASYEFGVAFADERDKCFEEDGVVK